MSCFCQRFGSPDAGRDESVGHSPFWISFFPGNRTSSEKNFPIQGGDFRGRNGPFAPLLFLGAFAQRRTVQLYQTKESIFGSLPSSGSEMVAEIRPRFGGQRLAGVAQLVEHRFCKPKVRGSSPLASSVKLRAARVDSRAPLVRPRTARTFHKAHQFQVGCPSGQREQAVNLPAYAYVGSNPTPSTIWQKCHSND